MFNLGKYCLKVQKKQLFRSWTKENLNDYGNRDFNWVLLPSLMTSWSTRKMLSKITLYFEGLAARDREVFRRTM